MPNLRERVEQRDRAAFVGRVDELACFDAILSGADPRSIVHVSGPAGIGKSTLLREVARRARSAGYSVRSLEGRDLPPFPEALESAIGPVTTDGPPLLIIIDSYELVGSLDGHLRSVIVPMLPDSSIIVLAGRTRPGPAWFEGGWDAVSRTIEVLGIGHSDAVALVRHHGLGIDRVDEIVRRSGGSPLALVIAAQAGGDGSMADLLDRLLGAEAEPQRARVLGVAALARVTTPELLEAVLPSDDPHESYKWLADRSFVEPLADGVALHSLVAQSIRDSLRDRDPSGEASLRRRVADYLYQRALAGQFSLSTDLQHLVIDQTVRWGYSLDVGSRYHIDSVRPGDADVVGGILRSVGVGAWWDLTEVFFTDHPECTGVVRDRNGRLGGYYVAVSPAAPPQAALDDVLLGPWLRHARDVLRTNSAVLWREAVDLTGQMGEVTSLLGSAGIIGSGVVNPRYGYLPISPTLPAALAFAEALGAAHISELDVATGGMDLQCYLIDFGPQGVLAFQRDWVYRESGANPPRPVAGDDDAGQLIRMLRDPAALAHGPSWLGSVPSVRIERLRELVRESLGVFGSSADDRLAHTIITAAYIDEPAAHESIARRLHLSRSAYFRRLQSATTRLGDELAARRRQSF
ncbi:MAG: AAA family ATPase [Ilumatobacteraceae bacterium]